MCAPRIALVGLTWQTRRSLALLYHARPHVLPPRIQLNLRASMLDAHRVPYAAAPMPANRRDATDELRATETPAAETPAA